LPKVWSEPDRCGPNATLYLDDPELRVIQDLGPAGRSKAIIEGVIATMKALEVATTLNIVSLDSEVRVNALGQERDALTAKVAALEEDARSQKFVAEERDRQIAALRQQIEETQMSLTTANAKKVSLGEEKVSLEAALKRASMPGEDETEFIAALSRVDLVDRVGELEGSLLDAVQLGFNRAVAQLKVVNPGVELCVEGLHHLSDVEDGVIKPPPVFEEGEEEGHVERARPDEGL